MVWPALAQKKDLADDFEQRLNGRDVRARARSHHRERAAFGAGHAAAYRAVDLHDVARGKELEDALSHHCAGGGKIDETPDAFAIDDSIRAGRDLQHNGGDWQAHHHGFGSIRDFHRRAHGDRA